MRLLQSYFNNGNANVLYFVQKYEFLFFWTDGTNELLQQLHNKVRHKTILLALLTPSYSTTKTWAQV
jgi:hypothetical protein